MFTVAAPVPVAAVTLIAMSDSPGPVSTTAVLPMSISSSSNPTVMRENASAMTGMRSAPMSVGVSVNACTSVIFGNCVSTLNVKSSVHRRPLKSTNVAVMVYSPSAEPSSGRTLSVFQSSRRFSLSGGAGAMFLGIGTPSGDLTTSVDASKSMPTPM